MKIFVKIQNALVNQPKRLEKRNQTTLLNSKNLRFFIMILPILLSFFLVIFISNTLPVSAQTNSMQARTQQILQVEPSLLFVTLSPGKTYDYKLRVTNLTSQALPVTISFESFDEENESGGYIFSPKKSIMEDWVNLSSRELLFNPSETKEIPMTVTIPSTVKLGGYSTVIFLNPILPQTTTGSKINAKIGVLALANIGIVDPKSQPLTIEQFGFTKTFSDAKSIESVLRVANSSLYYRTAKAEITLKPLIGKKQIFQLEEKFIFPGKTRRWERTIEAANYGIYTVEAAVSTGAGNKIYAKDYIVILPWKIIAVTILGGAFFIFVVIKRKRFLPAIKALIRG